MGTGGFSPGGKARPGRDADHNPNLLPMSIMSRSYNPPPFAPSWLNGTPLLFYFTLRTKLLAYFEFSLFSTHSYLKPVINKIPSSKQCPSAIVFCD
jgi:hypothetical protein